MKLERLFSHSYSFNYFGKGKTFRLRRETNCRYFIAHSVFLQEKMGLSHLKRSDNFEIDQIFEKL